MFPVISMMGWKPVMKAGDEYYNWLGALIFYLFRFTRRFWIGTFVNKSNYSIKICYRTTGAMREFLRSKLSCFSHVYV